MQREIALLTLSAALGLMGLNSGDTPIEPLPSLGGGVTLVSQNAPKEPVKPWYNCKTREVWTLEKQTWCQKVYRLKNARYEIPAVGVVQLKNGVYVNLAQNRRIVLIDRPGAIAFGDLNNDGKEDAAVLLAVRPDASDGSIFLSAVLNSTFLSQGNSAKNPTSALLGDHVKVRTIAIEDTHVKVEALKGGAQDPRCCPTQAVTQFYALQGERLSLLAKPTARIKQAQSWLDGKTTCS